MKRYERKAILIVEAADADEAEAAFKYVDGHTLDASTANGFYVVGVTVDDGVPEQVEDDDDGA